MRLLREELQLLQEPGSYVGEVVKAMGKNKVLVKVRIPNPCQSGGCNVTPRPWLHSAIAPARACVIAAGEYIDKCESTVQRRPSCAQVNPEGKYVVDLDKSIDVAEIKPNLRVALRNDSYVLHKV